MKRTYLLLAICYVPIIAAAQACLNWRPIDIWDVDRSSDGRVFGVVAPLGANTSSRREIREWSANLSDSRTTYRPRTNVDNIAVNDSGTVVAFQRGDTVSAVDVASGKIIWEESYIYLPRDADLFFSAEDRYLIVVGDLRLSNNWMNVFSAKDGNVIGLHEPAFLIRGVYSYGPYLTVTDFRNNREAFMVVNGVLTPIQDADVPNKESFQRYVVQRPIVLDPLYHGRSAGSPIGIRILPRTHANPATLEVITAGSGKVIHRYRAGLAERTVTFLRLFVAVAMIVWFLSLVRVGHQSKRPWRVFVDLAVVVALLHFVCFRSTDAQEINFGVFKVLALSGSTFFCLLFWLLLYNRKKFYALVAVLIACAISPAAPCIMLALVLWTAGFGIRWNEQVICGPGEEAVPASETNGSRFRFGTREMLLVTLYAAVFIGIGVYFVPVIGYGIAGMLLCVLGMGLSVHPLLARIGCGVCLWGIILLGCRWTSSYIAPMLIAALMVPMVFAFLRIYGYRIRRLPATQAAAVAVESAA